MGTTTNNGWPTPVATDLVKDGWEAIKDLGDAIDTTLGVYSPATPGLVKLQTVTFSAVASQSINDVFSTTYTNYLINLEATQSADADITLRLRVSGTDNTSSNYTYGRYYSGLVQSIVAGNEGNITEVFFPLGSFPTTRRGSSIININNPFATQNTSVTMQQAGKYFQVIGGVMSVTTSYTGFTIAPTSGTVTGSVSVYGYNK
jgi:hypothetical protein